MKHENGKPCERCAAMLKDADEAIEYWFYRIKEEFPTAHIAYVFRNKAEQDQMVKEGKSKLKWPNSKHNAFKNGKRASLAMDLFSLTDSGAAEFRMGYYVQIANWLEDQNAPIEWGGDWAHFKDGPHFQVKS